jgi:hypothetical protein
MVTTINIRSTPKSVPASQSLIYCWRDENQAWWVTTAQRGQELPNAKTTKDWLERPYAYSLLSGRDR